MRSVKLGLRVVLRAGFAAVRGVHASCGFARGAARVRVASRGSGLRKAPQDVMSWPGCVVQAVCAS